MGRRMGHDLSVGGFVLWRDALVPIGSRGHPLFANGSTIAHAPRRATTMLTGADLSPRHGYVGYRHGPGNPYSDEETPVPAAGDLPPTPSDLSGANLKGVRLTDANLDGVIWSNTTCPDGKVTNTGC
jgi:hypothetical protein